MNRKIRILAGCLVTLLLTAGTIHALGILSRPTDTDVVFNAIDTFHDLPENSLEVIGYGSSHMWTGMSSMELYEKYGVGAYNYGGHWQVINTTALFIKDSLRTQSPKLILVETFLVNEVRRDTNMNKAVEIYCTKAVPDFDGKRKYLRQCFGNDLESYFSYYVPLCAFHENWVNLCQASFLGSGEDADTDFYASMGYLCRDGVTPVSIADPSSFEQEPLSADAIACLDDIVSVCRERGIEIIFYTAPWEGIYNYADAMTEYAAENGCVYLNLFEYMDEIGLDCEKDFYDVGHLNDRGAVKVTDFLGEYIVGHYDISDMRTVEGNLWEQNLC